jgi:asparagine synthetase B (glutamine-hydrolysing)
MCGISGIFAYHDLAPPVDEGELLRVRDRMVARGPDAAGLWISDKPVQEKSMIARSVAPELPEAILNRPKTGFAVPIYQWLNPGAPSNISNHRVWAQMLVRNFTQSA